MTRTDAVFYLTLLLLLSACGGGNSGNPTLHGVKITWTPNRETAVNSPGGGYHVYYATSPNFDISKAGVLDIPFLSGPTAPITTVISLASGSYYLKVTAYSALNTEGSTPSQEISVVVP